MKSGTSERARLTLWGGLRPYGKHRILPVTTTRRITSMTSLVTLPVPYRKELTRRRLRIAFRHHQRGVHAHLCTIRFPASPAPLIPKTGTITYSYDPNGNLLKKIAPQLYQTGT